ncbi:ATP synthase F1 subunit epsilon [Aestuariispira ectoiniformans]|uniref:ATP synthase F1 subunit epsilon n=1 Tax=Aestuariispira ectoiniformans TaxID=2775080 RepID=UPI00223AD819|nr:ATP synthase F1 subunit epsilon [Aestuariispira ectoiniformans]
MADTVAFELVSPEKLLLSQDVEMVVLPAAEGDLGVLPGHSPVISTVRPGTISVFKSGNVEQRIFVAGGFLEVTKERCTVLAEEVVNVSEIDIAAAKQLVSDFSDDVRTAKNAEDKAAAEAGLAVAVARVAAAEQPAYA